MRTLLATLLLSGLVTCQEPEKGGPTPKPLPQVTGEEPAQQQPPKQETPKQQTPKQETPKPEPKPGESGKGQPAPVEQEQKPQPKGDEPRIDRPEEDDPMPRGASPEDIRAMRGAEAMLVAERKLAEMLKAGKITGLDKILPFDELTAWTYQDGLKGMPQSIKELAGKKVLMTGFMLPIDEVRNIKEFLLVQSLWSCCYGQPPDIHGLVRVVMPKGKTTDYFFDPLKIVGTFKVEATYMEGYCVDIYQLQLESLEVLR
jgi:hypothetical protein